VRAPVLFPSRGAEKAVYFILGPAGSRPNEQPTGPASRRTDGPVCYIGVSTDIDGGMGSLTDVLHRMRSGSPQQDDQMAVERSMRFRWVPVRSLSERHRPRLLAHLVALDDADRYFRFGHPASDEQIARYVEGIDFRHDEVFGIFNRRLELIAIAHLAYQDTDVESESEAEPGRLAEFGVSVLRRYRGRGFGSRLFEHSVLHARNRGVERLMVHALTENTPMLHIARNAGAVVERDGGESDAWLKLPPDDVGSHIDELLTEHAAELDYQVKRQGRRIVDLMGSITEASAHIHRSRKRDAG
jgi:GNAT superfamily N-acetyltransferase